MQPAPNLEKIRTTPKRKYKQPFPVASFVHRSSVCALASVVLRAGGHGARRNAQQARCRSASLPRPTNVLPAAQEVSSGGSSSAKRRDLAAGPTCSARTAPRYGEAPPMIWSRRTFEVQVAPQKDQSLCDALIEPIRRKIRVRGSTPENAPRIRAGMEKKEQKPELKKNQTRRCYAEKTSIFFQTTDRHPPGARRETTEVKTRKC